MKKPLNLKTRLIVTLLALLAIGLTVMGAATLIGTRTYLDNKTDEQLSTTIGRAKDILEDDNNIPMTEGNFRGPLQNSEIEVRNTPALNDHNPPPLMEPQFARITATGTIERQVYSNFGSSFKFSSIPQNTLASGKQETTFFNISDNDQSYRGMAFRLTGTDDVGVVVVPTGDTSATLNRLMVLLSGIGLGIFALAALLSWRIIGLGLKPLKHMAEVTEAIAQGSTKERVIPAQDSEMARLGRSINRAFDTRDKSESQLRSFIADASHELRTPLTSIRGYAELLNQGAMNNPEKLSKASTRIEKEATRLGVMVQDLLTIARLDEGKTLQKTDTDIVPIIHDVISDAAVIDPDRTVNYLGPRSFIACVDEAAVRQILTNLLSNIRAHTPAGTACDINCKEHGQYLLLSVRDYGQGMSEENQKRAFNRFWRENPSKRTSDSQHSGSGLGLAIVSSLAHAHDGYAEAVTPAGKGVQMNIYLSLTGK